MLNKFECYCVNSIENSQTNCQYCFVSKMYKFEMIKTNPGYSITQYVMHVCCNSYLVDGHDNNRRFRGSVCVELVEVLILHIRVFVGPR